MSVYTFLNPDDIRLLTVNVNDGLVTSVDLHTYPRTEAPKYDAVSYTWGADASTVSVACNGLAVEIRTHLHRALPFIHNFRPEPKTRPLWIDAICLNQDDREEKAVHVPRMGDTYENAARTLIWLGEAADNSDLAMDDIESLTKKMLAVENSSSLTFRQRTSRYDLPPPEDRVWEAIKVLQLRPWIYRLWTLQEVVLSKEAVLLCGRKSIPWDSLVALHQAAIHAQLNILVYLEKESDGYNHSQLVVSHVNFLRTQINRNAITLPMLLTLSADRGYSLPIDRVWALVGMLNRKYQRLLREAKIVDYSEAAVTNYHNTFVEIAKFHVKHDTKVAMTLIEDNSRIASNPALPSWIPDWHTDRSTIPLARWPEALAGIPGGQYRHIEPFMQVNKDASLDLCGLVVDIVERVTASPGKKMLDLESFPWLIECLDIINSTPFIPYDVYPETAAVDVPPTTWEDGSPMDERRHRCKRAEEVLKYTLFPPNVLETSPRTILRCNGRKFFRSKSSRLGIGPADLEGGDLLCAMYGARTLWALRPLKSSENRDIKDQEFKLLGSAYTPSLLKGQAWQGKSCEEMQRFRLK